MPIDFHGDRIDQEGHVIVDEFNDGGRCFPAVFCQSGIEDAHLRRTALEFIAEREMRKRKCCPLPGIACDKVFGVDFIAVFGCKHLGLVALSNGRLGGDQFFNFSEECGFAIFCLGGHVEFPRFFYGDEIIFRRGDRKLLRALNAYFLDAYLLFR